MWVKKINRIFSLSLFFAIIIPNSIAFAADDKDYAKVFNGKWITYSREFASNGNFCTMGLSGQKANDMFLISTSNCAGVLNNIGGWAIDDGQFALVSKDRTVLATLGGNQFRLSGQTKSPTIPFILERNPQASQALANRKSIQCSYLGYGKQCAKPRQFAPPVFEGDKTAPVKILVKLNVRSEPRLDAEILGVLKSNSCVDAYSCTTASDGLWCSAKFGKQLAWFKKQTIRQGKWPIMTFVTNCN